jgi:hypothetical protein
MVHFRVKLYAVKPRGRVFHCRDGVMGSRGNVKSLRKAWGRP